MLSGMENTSIKVDLMLNIVQRALKGINAHFNCLKQNREEVQNVFALD